ncbi:MAG: hypothetical protein HOM58_19595 [Rhodospirillaceae bacterium]|nr:hypothetical protein [Rhodospirillaceae bacterium]
MIVRTTRVLAEIAAASLLGIMLLTGAAAWRLSQGPVPLNFLTPHFEEALNGHGAPFRVTLEKTILAWAGWERTLDIRVVDVRATAKNGRLIAQVPEISVSVSVRGLLQGIVAPTSLDLIGGSLQLVRRKNGELAMTFGDLTGEGEDSIRDAVFERLIEVLSAEPSPDRPASYLRRVSILDARLRIDDRSAGVVWGAPETNIILLREDGEIQGTFFTQLDIGGSITAVNGAASWQPNSDIIRIDTEFSGVRTDRVAAKLPFLKGVESLRLNVRGRVGSTITLDGELRDANFDLVAGQGQATYSAFWPSGLPIKSAHIQGSFDGDTGSLEIDKLLVDLDGPKLSGRTTVLKLGDGLAIDGVVTIDRLKLEALSRYWPGNVASRPRKWVLENMPSGIVEGTKATLSLRIPDLATGDIRVESFAGKLRLRDTTIYHVKGLPPIRKMAATAVFSRDRFIGTVRSGVAKKLKVRSASVRLTNLDKDTEQADIDVTVEGALEDALSMIDRPPLGFVSLLGMQPTGVSGRTTTDLTFSFPIDRSIELADVDIRGRARLTDINVPNFAFGRTISADSLTLKVDKAGLELSGEANVGLVPATIKWIERFDEKEPYKRRYEAQAVLDKDGRKAAGLPDLSPYLTGPVSVDLSYLQAVKGKKELALKFALKNAGLWLPGLHWRKQAGEEGVAWLSIDLQSDSTVNIRQFDLRTGTLSLDGSVAFDENRALARAVIGKFKHGRTNVSATIAPHADGGFNLDVRGSEFDATPFLKEDDTTVPQATTLPNLHINATLDRIWFDEEKSFSNLSARLTGKEGEWQKIDATGHLGAGHEIKLSYEVAPIPQLSIKAANAGETLRALDLFGTMQGGTLLLSARKSDKKRPEAWIGTLDVTDFVMVKAPVLAKVLTNLSLTGIQNNLSGKGIQFVKLDVPFEFENDIFKILNARSVGSELGITVEGTVDRGKDVVDLRGTIVPAYTINSVLGNIPVLGTLLTGKKGSGVFAATYKIGGSVDNPKISVNPLAALAPGFLRNLIGIFDGSIKPDGGNSSVIPDTN